MDGGLKTRALSPTEHVLTSGLGPVGTVWFCSGRGPMVGGSAMKHYGSNAIGAEGPSHKVPRLGPRPFSISLLNSFGDNFAR